MLAVQYCALANNYLVSGEGRQLLKLELVVVRAHVLSLALELRAELNPRQLEVKTEQVGETIKLIIGKDRVIKRNENFIF